MGAGVFFLLVGLAMIAFSFIAGRREDSSFRSWPSVAGVVTELQEKPAFGALKQASWTSTRWASR